MSSTSDTSGGDATKITDAWLNSEMLPKFRDFLDNHLTPNWSTNQVIQAMYDFGGYGGGATK